MVSCSAPAHPIIGDESGPRMDTSSLPCRSQLGRELWRGQNSGILPCHTHTPGPLSLNTEHRMPRHGSSFPNRDKESEGGIAKHRDGSRQEAGNVTFRNDAVRLAGLDRSPLDSASTTHVTPHDLPSPGRKTARRPVFSSPKALGSSGYLPEFAAPPTPLLLPASACPPRLRSSPAIVGVGNRWSNPNLVKSQILVKSIILLSSSVSAMITKGGGWFAGFVGVLLFSSLPCTSPVQVGAQELGSRASCGKSPACPEEWNRGACCHGGSRRRHRQSGCVGRAAASVDSCGGGLGRRLRGGSGGRDSELGLRGQKAGRQDEYLKSGFISVCEARFEARTAGSYLAIEDDGKVVRNVEYGASCARTAMPMKAGDGPLVHYVELELKGGGAPFKDFKGLEFNGTWMPYTQQGGEDGTIGCTVGIMASLGPDDEPLNMVDTTLPDDSFVWCRRGKATWWFGELGVSALSKLDCSDFKESLEIHSGDRIGVLVDLHASRLGFLRNGTIVRELTRDLSSVLPTYELHFVVGGQRPNMTWTMVPPAQAWQSLKAMDWDAWRDTPSCESILETVKDGLSDKLWAEYVKEMGNLVWSDPAARRLFPNEVEPELAGEQQLLGEDDETSSLVEDDSDYESLSEYAFEELAG